MSESIEFDEVYQYNTLKSGITVMIKIAFGDEIRELSAKIDTGAENCIFERKHGERLGIDIETGKERIFSTATGLFTTFGHEIKLSILGIETDSTVYFATKEAFTRNVLGRQGWLDRIKLGLIDYEGKLFLRKYNQ